MSLPELAGPGNRSKAPPSFFTPPTRRWRLAEPPREVADGHYAFHFTLVSGVLDVEAIVEQLAIIAHVVRSDRDEVRFTTRSSPATRSLNDASDRGRAIEVKGWLS